MSSEEPAVKRVSQGRVECTVTFSEADIAPAEKTALEKLGADIKMEGFRAGKVPADMLKDKVDPEALLEETVRNLLPTAFENLTKEHDIQPIIPPRVEAVSKEPLTLKIVFIEKPEVKLKGIKKIKIEKKEPKVDEKDIERMSDYILKQHEQTKVVLRAAKEGDRVTMDFWAEGEDKKEIPEIRSEGHQVILGSKTLLPGFEDALVGKETGEETSFPLTFPDKYHAEQLQGKPVTFHVTIKQIDEVELPELTDEFAKNVLKVESAKAFKEQLKESMVQQEEQIERKRREQEALEEIRKATKVELAPELVEDEMRALIEELQQQLEQQQTNLQEWIEKSGKKPEEVEKELKEKAEHRLTLRLGMQQLVEEEEIDISDDEMTQAVEEFLAPLSEQEQSQMRSAYVKGARAYDQLKWQKMVERIIAQMLEK